MPSPPISVFLTTIASQPALRQRQGDLTWPLSRLFDTELYIEYLLRILQVKKIPFSSYDLASDEDAKRLWKRKAPSDKQQLPGILVGGRFPGTFAEFEDAVEYDELDRFLRLKESWDPSRDQDYPILEVKPVGVPGVALPLQMASDHMRNKIMAQQKSPEASGTSRKNVPVNKREGDVGIELKGYGLQGVHATKTELEDLVRELGLYGDDAGDLVKGLAGESLSEGKSSQKQTDGKD
ncbi:hypothetical protein APHAL10511_006111 [Amanita phalloides]|nr:hypothetical protein APHAL10511_006111 [Amanita phalloides]